MLIKIKDKEYELSGLTIEIQESFEKLMEAKTLQLLKQNKSKLDVDYLTLLEKYFFDVNHGNYKVGSDNFYLFIQQKEYLVELLWWCFCKNQFVDKSEVAYWVDTDEHEVCLIVKQMLQDLALKKN